MYIFAAHPVFESFFQSDWMGKGIYLGLFFLSILSWTLLVQKIWIMRTAGLQCEQFSTAFKKQKANPLKFEGGGEHPLAEVFETLKKQTLELLNKNFKFTKKSGSPAYLSPTDIDFIEAHIASSISGRVLELEKNVYVLSTIVTLAPFLGLLGTVWGILVTFSELQGGGGNTNQMVLGGLSLALTTTVIGLLVAIPALIGYNYIKNRIKELQVQMETFSEEALASIELQYRKPDIG